MDAIKASSGTDCVHVETSTSSDAPHNTSPAATGGNELQEYKVYKRRFFGLAQLVLLNTIVSWDVCETVYTLVRAYRKTDREREREGERDLERQDSLTL